MQQAGHKSDSDESESESESDASEVEAIRAQNGTQDGVLSHMPLPASARHTVHVQAFAITAVLSCACSDVLLFTRWRLWYLIAVRLCA